MANDVLDAGTQRLASDERALLLALRERLARAEDGSDDEAFVGTAVELLNHLQSQRGGTAGAVDLDLAALLGSIERLQDIHAHEPALGLAFAARDIAGRARDSAGRARRDLVARVELLALTSCLALCEHEPATHCLARVLAIPKEDVTNHRVAWTDAQLLEAASAIPALDEREAADLALTALVTTARWAAAVGRYALADAALDRATESLPAEDAPYSATDLRLLRAATALDASGRLPRGHRASVDSRWALLEAKELALRGRLSEAKQRYGEIADDARADPITVRAAHLARAQVLCRLNRVGEALELLEKLPDDPETRRAAELLQSRSGGALPEAAPTALEIMRGPARGSPYRTAASEHPTTLGTDPSSRSCEHLSHEIVRRTQEAQLALHRGNMLEAECVVGPARAWMDGCDSELARARMTSVEALIRYYTGRLAEAGSLASQARVAFLELEMPVEASAAVRLLRWVALREGRIGDEKTLRREQDALLDRIGSLLSADDRNLWLTNKWSEADESVSDSLAVLRCGCALGQARGARRERARSIGATLHAIDLARSWDLPDGDARETDVAAGPDALVRAQLVLRRHARHIDEAERIRGWCLAGDTAVVRYLVLPDRIETIVVSRADAVLLDVQNGSTRVALRDVLGKALSWLMRRATEWSPDAPALCKLARLLSIEPIARHLPPTVERLVVVPDDVLFQVPFGALPLDGDVLARRFTVEIAPVARYRARSRPAIRRDTRIVAVGVSESRDASLRALPETGREIEAIRARHPARLIPLQGEAASRANVTAAIASAGVAHFACHGRLDLSTLDTSGLLFRDGWSGLEAIAKMDLGATDLVVAAACWSGSSTVLAGREVMSLPTVLLRAGARAVIASVYEVNDVTSPDFVGALYGRLRTHDPAAALANTQVDWRRKPPRDWAGHVVFSHGAPPATLAIPLIALGRAWQRIGHTRPSARLQLSEHTR